ncbi:thioredoxin fold domain-containing protein [Candidatus Micrarchaeota archaeon]|nr:thioredoxin fold domain-containing protein [Candidatus Micrarchaeota archaeon]
MDNKTKIIAGVGVLLVIFAFAMFAFPESGYAMFNAPEEISEPDLNIDPPIQESNNKVTLYFFWGDGCGFCSKQKVYLEELRVKYPDLEIQMFETWKDASNKALFQQTAASYGIEVRGVPTTFIGEKHWIGFADSMKGDMEAYIDYCYQNGCASPLDK